MPTTRVINKSRAYQHDALLITKRHNFVRMAIYPWEKGASACNMYHDTQQCIAFYTETQRNPYTEASPATRRLSMYHEFLKPSAFLQKRKERKVQRATLICRAYELVAWQITTPTGLYKRTTFQISSLMPMTNSTNWLESQVKQARPR